MQAETAYNVIQALPESEKARLYSMLKLEEKSVQAKPSKHDLHWTVQEATDYLVKLFAQQSIKRKSTGIKKPEAVTSGRTRIVTPLKKL